MANNRLTIKTLHDHIGITPDIPGYGVAFGPRSKAALFATLSNRNAPALSDADFAAFASRMNVPIGYVKGVRKIEAPRGPYDDEGRPSILYERHVAWRNASPTERVAFPSDLFHPRGYGAGGYGSYGGQYDKLAAACAYDPDAALKGCSWGAFQVLGENADALDYDGVWDMVSSLVDSEAAHLECFRRFIEWKRNPRTGRPLIEHLRECRPGDPDSCIPFVEGYNGTGYREFSYHTKLAKAITV